MLQQSNAFSSFSVKDLAAARDFYKNTLGLTIRDNSIGMLELHLHGNNMAIVYEKKDHKPAKFTILNFPVKNIDEAVKYLSEKGIKFLQYDDPKTDDKGISRKQGPPIAWFTDPAKNILSVIQTEGA